MGLGSKVKRILKKCSGLEALERYHHRPLLNAMFDFQSMKLTTVFATLKNIAYHDCIDEEILTGIRKQIDGLESIMAHPYFKETIRHTFHYEYFKQQYAKFEGLSINNDYNILSVKKDDSDEDIKNAWRSLENKYHPDKNNGDRSFEDNLTQIREAYSKIKKSRGIK